MATSTRIAASASTIEIAYAPAEVEALVALLDAERGRLRLALDAAGDDGHGAVLAEAARGREDDAVDDGPADRRQRDAPERLPAAGAERARGLLLLVPHLAQRRHDLAGDERERDEDRRDHHRRQGEEHVDAVVGQPAAEPALAAVEQEEREPDDDGRERERQVDERVEEALARELPADDRDRADDPEDGVHGHGDRGDDEGELERVDRLRRRQRVPRRREPVLERPPEDHRERPDEDHGEVAEGDEAEAEPAHRSCLVAKWRMAPIDSSATNEIASSTTETAAAPAESPLSMRPKM